MSEKSILYLLLSIISIGAGLLAGDLVLLIIDNTSLALIAAAGVGQVTYIVEHWILQVRTDREQHDQQDNQSQP